MFASLVFYLRLSRSLMLRRCSSFSSIFGLDHRGALPRARPGRLMWTGDRGLRRRLDRPVRRPQDRRPQAVVPDRSGLSADRAGLDRREAHAPHRPRLLGMSGVIAARCALRAASRTRVCPSSGSRGSGYAEAARPKNLDSANPRSAGLPRRCLRIPPAESNLRQCESALAPPINAAPNRIAQMMASTM